MLGAGLLLAAPGARAAVKNWAGTTSGYWGTGSNWTGGVAPINGDDLVFPVGGRAVNTNNFTNLKVKSITFTGGTYDVRGNALTVTNGISSQQAAGANLFECNVTLGAAQTVECTTAGTSLYLEGNLTNGGFTLTVSGNGTVGLDGSISGSGGVTKNGTGTLSYGGGTANTYSGATLVNSGTLLLTKTIANGGVVANTLTIGDGSGAAGSAVVRLATNSQIPDTPDIVINADGLLDLNDIHEVIGDSLTLNDGEIQMGTGVLTLAANSTISISGNPHIYGKLSVGTGTCTIQGSGYPIIYADVSGSANIVKNGNVAVWLYGANTFTGTLTANTGGYIYALSDLALGATNGGTIINNSAYLALGGGVSITGEALTMNTADSYALDSVGSVTNIWAGPVSLSRDTMVYVASGGVFDIIGSITGAGGITKWGPGILRYSGGSANTYGGDTTVNEGILELAKTVNSGALQSPLVIGDGTGTDRVRCLNNNQFWSTSLRVRVNSSGVLDLGDRTDYIGPLTLEGGQVTTSDTGLIWLYDSVTVVGNSVKQATIDGQAGLYLDTVTFTNSGHNFSPDLRINATVRSGGSANSIGVIKNGGGEVMLASSNSFVGPVTINGGTLWIGNSFALGNTNTPVTVNSGGTLFMYAFENPVLVGAKPLVLNGSGYYELGALGASYGNCSWAGQVTLASDSVIDNTSSLELSGPIIGPSGFTKRGSGTLTLSGTTANTYAGTTMVNEGTLVLSKSSIVKSVPGNLVIGDGSGSDTVTLASNNQLALTADVLIRSGGLLECGAYWALIDTLRGSGTVHFGTGGYLAVGESSGTSTFDGPMTGVGYGLGYTLAKMGTGTFTMNGNASFSAGITHVYDAGKLVVNGSISSAVTVESGCTLGGTGTVGAITDYGVVSPGASAGKLSSGNVAFGSAGSLAIELNGNTVGSGYDQLNTVGTVNLTGAALSPLTVGFLPQQGDQFIIVNNDSTDAVTGAFDGLSEGAVVSDSTGKFHFRLSYTGSSGNDVVLTMTNQSLTGGAAYVLSGNGNGAIETNECNFLNLVINNISAYAMSGLSATLQSLTPGVVVVQPFSTYPNVPAGYSRTNDAFFQITTQPGFACGDTVNLELQVATATHGTLKVPFSLPSGVAGSVVRYNNAVVTAIPDGGSVDKTFTVSGITTPLKKVAVSLHITHTADSDLDMWLIGPDGTMVTLSTDNGGTSSDYGTDCTDKSRTTFDSTASTPITSGTAPFVGIYRPEGSLAAFNEKSGSDVNGTWTLRIADDTAGAVGSIRCCSLFLYPTACTPGSGICELCPEVTLNGSLGAASPQEAGRLVRDGVVATCAAPKVCPGLNDSTSRSYNAHTFFNGPSDACITVSLTGALGDDLFSAAYLGSFVPASLCANYLADCGSSTGVGGTPRVYSFNVAANQVFVLTVNEVTAGSGGDYALSVTGGNCRPVLNITRAGASNVALDWTTAAPGYRLEATNRLNGVPWVMIPPYPPVVVNGKFTVSNAMDSIKFYRLHKP